MRRFLTATAIVLSLTFSGCANVSPDRNDSAIVIINKPIPLSNVKGAVIDSYMADGWKLDKESDHLLTFSKENNSLGAKILFSSRYDSRVMNRETVTITGQPGNITLRATQEAIGNSGSAFERANTVKGNEQERLMRIKGVLYSNY